MASDPPRRRRQWPKLEEETVRYTFLVNLWVYSAKVGDKSFGVRQGRTEADLR